MGFRNRSLHNLDDKGRLNLPSKVREVLTRNYDDQLVATLSSGVTNGEVDRCIHLYPRTEFDRLEEKLKTAPASDPVIVAVKRKVIQNAEEVVVDKQGRVLVPPMLRENVGLSEKVVLVGNGNILEIWSPEAWQRAQDVDKTLIEQQNRLAQYGL